MTGSKIWPSLLNVSMCITRPGTCTN
jgi:hypothetical protein